MPANIFGYRVPDLELHAFDSAYTPGTAQQFTTAAWGDFMPDFWYASNSDTIPHLLQYSLNGSANVVAQVTIPAGAGYNGVPPIDVLAAIFGTTRPQIVWSNENGAWPPWVAVMEAITATKVVETFLLGGWV